MKHWRERIKRIFHKTLPWVTRPANQYPSVNEDIKSSLAQASIASQRGDHAAVIAICELARKSGGQSDPDVLALLGTSYAAMGATSLAVDRLRQAVAAGADNASTHRTLGRALQSLSYSEAAEKALQRSLELEPNSAATLSVLAAVYRWQSRLSEAIEAISHAASIDPSVPGYAADRATCLLQACEWQALRQAKLKLSQDLEIALQKGEKPSIPPLLAISLGFSANDLLLIARSRANRPPTRLDTSTTE